MGEVTSFRVGYRQSGNRELEFQLPVPAGEVYSLELTMRLGRQKLLQTGHNPAEWEWAYATPDRLPSKLPSYER